MRSLDSSLWIVIVTHPSWNHHVCAVRNLPYKHESCFPSCTGPNPGNSHLLTWCFIADNVRRHRRHLPPPQWTCCSVMRHQVSILSWCVTRSLFFLHARCIPWRLFPIPGWSWFSPGFLSVQLRQWAQDTQSYQRPRPKNESRHCHHERRPLWWFPCKSSKSNSRDVRANSHETAEHSFPTHVRLVHHEVWQHNNQQLQRESTVNGHRLASL